MPRESAKPTISTFTGRGQVRVVDDADGAALSRNMDVDDLATEVAAELGGAAAITVTDTDGYFDGDDVEAVLAEIGETLSSIEPGATGDQTGEEIVTAFTDLVPLASETEAEELTVTEARQWTPERIGQAIEANAAAGNVPNGGTTGQVLTKASNTNLDVEWATISGSGGVSPFMCTLWKNGSNFVGHCQIHGTIVTNSDPETAWQALYDHISGWSGSGGHTGGAMMMNLDGFNVNTQLIARPVATGSAAIVPGTSAWPVRVMGQGFLPRPPATSGAVGGTMIRWSDASPPSGSGLNQGAIIVAGDAHGCRFENFGIDCNNIARRGAVSYGRQTTWDWVQVRNIFAGGFNGGNLTPMTSNLQTVGIGILVTNGNDSASDRYVQQRVTYCDMIGDNGGIGVVIRSLGSGSSCTDGRVEELQMNGCNHGALYVGEGGWEVSQGHFTQNGAGSGGKNWNLWLDAGFLTVKGTYVDIVQAGPSVRVTNNNFSITGMFINTNNKPASTYPAIEVGGSKGTITGLTLGGTGACTFMVNGTGVGPLMTGCWSPVSACNAIAPGSFTRVANCVRE